MPEHPGQGRTWRKPGLESLLGTSDVSTFMQEHWEASPWLGRGRMPAPLTPVEVEDYVSLGHISPSDLRIFRDGVQVEPDEYVMPRRNGQDVVVRPDRVVRLFGQGCTLVLESVHLRFPSVAQLCRSLTEDLDQPTQANAYYTPPRSTGFTAHHDTHDVFVVQIAGSKHWRVNEPLVELPLPHQPFDRATATATPPALEHRLVPGEVLYLPRGWVHQADTDDETSLHLTVGVLVYTWYEELRAALRLASVDEPLLRRAAGTGPPEEVLARVLNRLGTQAVCARSDAQTLAASNPPVPGRFDDVLGRLPVTENTLLVRRAEVPVHVSQAPGGLEVRLPERTLKMSRRIADEVRWITSTEDAFRASDIPGSLSDTNRVALLRRLVREGLLRAQSS
jgi:hypothetical protein